MARICLTEEKKMVVLFFVVVTQVVISVVNEILVQYGVNKMMVTITGVHGHSTVPTI